MIINVILSKISIKEAGKKYAGIFCTFTEVYLFNLYQK